MAATTHLDTLKINVLTQEQFDSNEKNENELYMITDSIGSQPDWTETDSTSLRYIANTPSIQAGTGLNSVIAGDTSTNIASGLRSFAIGDHTEATETSSWAEGSYAVASGRYAHAAGRCVDAVGEASHAEGGRYLISGGEAGFSTTISCDTYPLIGDSDITIRGSAAYGVQSHAEGGTTFAFGFSSHAEGSYTKALGKVSHAGGYYTVANHYQTAIGKYNTISDGPTGGADTTGDIFIVGIGTGGSARANGLRVTATGATYGVGSFHTSGADYAEMWEWADGNIDNVDRRGLFVTVNAENKLNIAEASDDVIGIISSNPAVLGNTYSEHWRNRYLTDVFGEYLTEVVEIPEEILEDGTIVPAYKETRFIENPNYDPEQTYISRDKRQEWAKVGLLGQLIVCDDGTCVAGGYCTHVNGGIATNSETGWRVLERLDESHIKILFK